MTDRPTDQLVAEHDRILLLLHVLARLADEAESAEPDAVDEGLLDDVETAVNGIRRYADALHHGKEEALLFPALEARGIPRAGGPIGCMLHEHEEGRALVDLMEDGLGELRKGEGARTFAEAVASFVPLLRQHIHKENNVLFPMAEQVLDPGARAELMTAFAAVEREDIGLDELERLRASIDDLAARRLNEAVA